MSHAHAAVTTIRERAFFGPVALRDENHAAHGNIRRTEECSECGARREVNINRAHRDEGPWGPTRDERRAAARRLVDDAQGEVTIDVAGGRPIRVQVEAVGGDSVRVRIDGEGRVYDRRDWRVPAGTEGVQSAWRQIWARAQQVLAARAELEAA